jgi:hypothetical protein
MAYRNRARHRCCGLVGGFLERVMGIIDLVLLLCVVMLIRNALAARYTLRRLDEIHARNLARLDSGTWSPDDTEEYKRVEGHLSLVLDMRRWTYRQFFPEQLT